MEKSLANIAQTAYWTKSENQDLFGRVATAVESEVLSRLKKSEVEPVAGQELTFVQVARWVEKHESTKGLQWRCDRGEWLDEDVNVLYSGVDYRVAPKKTNDPTTWEEGVAIFCRDYEDDAWVLNVFRGYSEHRIYKYSTEHNSYKHAKLATPEQIEAWNKTQGD